MTFLKMRNIFTVAVCAISFWLVFTAYNYFFDKNKPLIILENLENDKYYAGNLACKITGSDSYGVSYLCVSLDDKPFVDKFRLGNKKTFNYDLSLDTLSIPDGKHSLKIEATDGTFRHNNKIREVDFYVDNTPLQVDFVRPANEHKVFQGRTLHLQFQSRKKIKSAYINLLSGKYCCSPEGKNSNIYECFIPIDCEELASEYPFELEVEDLTGGKVNLSSKFQIDGYPFKKQTLGFNAKKLEEEREASKEQKLLEQEMVQISNNSPSDKLWKGQFYVPMDNARITCEYGMARTTQEKGHYRHKAIDMVALPKCVIWAPQDGIVSVKDRFAETGNTVVIDHGLGIVSLLCHLDSFANINVGDKIKRGNPVGTMGKTGYATGYHLHWEMRLNNKHIDPMQWTKLKL